MNPSADLGIDRGSARLALLLVAAALTPPALAAQEGCILGDEGENDVYIETLPVVGRITYIGGPHFVCDGGVQIWGDSAVAYAEREMSHLIGSVRYEEAGRVLRAAEARYWSTEGRLQATGDVVLVDDAQGSRIENGDLVYLLQTDFRDEAEMTVTTGPDGRRPRAVLTPPDRGAPADSVPADTVGAEPPAAVADSLRGAPPEPYTVVADRIFLRGSGYFTASGATEIVRDSLFAFADSAEYAEDGGPLNLVGSARVEGESYELTGRTITMTDPGGADSEVTALREARLDGEEVQLSAARIVVSLRDDALERLVATRLAPPGTPDADSVDFERPEAFVEDYVLTADSLEVQAPTERLQRVFAAGSARSVSTARDSLNAEVLPELARNDWLEGDTVIIRFEGSPPVPPLASPPSDSTVEVAAETAPDSVTTEVGAGLPADSVADAATERPDPDVGPEELAPYDLDATGSDADERPPVEEVVARGRARSLYRLPPSDSTFQAGVHAPAVHYVVGREIRILLDGGEVREMRVTGQAQGVHLEPLRRGAPADTAGAAVDTVGVPVDTTDAAIDTTGAAIDTTRATIDTTSATPDPTAATGAKANDSARPAYHTQPNEQRPALIPRKTRVRRPRIPHVPPEAPPWIRR